MDVYDVLPLFETVIMACLRWFEQIIDSINAGPIIFAAFCVVGVISMIFMPFRGGYGISLGLEYGQPIHKPVLRDRTRKLPPGNQQRINASSTTTHSTSISRRD